MISRELKIHQSISGYGLSYYQLERLSKPQKCAQKRYLPEVLILHYDRELHVLWPLHAEYVLCCMQKKLIFPIGS